MPDQFADIQAKIRAFMRDETRETFEELALQLFQVQRQTNPAYSQLCRVRGIGDVKNWREIPAVPTVAFKELEITALHPAERKHVFYSSGTTQKDPSRHFHSDESIRIYEESLWRWFEENFRKRFDVDKWIFLTPPASKAPNSSLVHMFGLLSSRQRGAEFFGDVNSDGTWTIDFSRLLPNLIMNRSVAILGTAFQFVHLLDKVGRVVLPENSWIFETGGYKGRSREVPKEELRRQISERFGMPPERIFSEYGMSELSSQAYDSADGIFRFPPWARARIISPATGTEVTDGTRGLLRVYDLANIWSVMAVQTEDFAIKTGGGFQLTGRAAQAEARGCSLMTA